MKFEISNNSLKLDTVSGLWPVTVPLSSNVIRIDIMLCPYCYEVNDLSWKRYFMSPMGRHTCHSCGNKFRMMHTIKYYSAITGLWLVGGAIPSIILLNLGTCFKYVFITYWIVGLGIVLPFDRKISNSWRGTIPIRNKESV